MEDRRSQTSGSSSLFTCCTAIRRWPTRRPVALNLLDDSASYDRGILPGVFLPEGDYGKAHWCPERSTRSKRGDPLQNTHPTSLPDRLAAVLALIYCHLTGLTRTRRATCFPYAGDSHRPGAWPT